MRVLVTGSGGFVASHLLPELVERGHHVLGVVRGDAPLPAGVQRLQWDLAAPGRPALPAFDAVVHLAQANVAFPERARELYAVNTTATLTLLDAARESGATRFVLASTGGVYGSGERRFTEDDRVLPGEFYAVTKLHAESLAAQYESFLEPVVLRIFTPYGPGQEGRIVARLIDAVRARRPVTLAGDQGLMLTPIFVGDVVRAFVAALEGPASSPVNVAGDEAVSLRVLAERVGSLVGAEPVFERLDGPSSGVMGDNARMRGELGLDELVPLDEGLRRTVGETVATP